MTKKPTVLAILILIAALTGCEVEGPPQMIESAKSYLAKGDQKAAIIQLKTVLQQEPASGEARLLLGKALLASGDASGAAVELSKALERDQPKEAVLPELARALAASGEFARLSDNYADIELADAAAQADLKASLAAAYGALGKRDEAARAIAAALKAQPGYARAVILQARLTADGGDLDGAIASVAELTAREPKNLDAWLVKGELLSFGKHDPKAALEAYRQAIAAAPTNPSAHAGAMTMLLAMRDADGAKAQLTELTKVLPGHPQTLYFEASVALLARELDKAQDLVSQLVRVAADNPRVLQLAGAVAYERGEMMQAESHLTRALQLAPGQDAARRLLALAHLRSAQPAKALAVLQPMLQRPQPGAQTYSLLAQAQLQSGDIDDAQANFAKAAKLDPNDTRSRAALAVTRLARGDNNAFAELESLAAADSGTEADLPLISALVARKDYRGALAAIDKLEAKLDKPQPMTWNLRGQVEMRRGDRPAARAAFAKALEVQPAFFPAAAALAGLDVAEEKTDAARKRFDDVLAADPDNAQALLAIAALKVRTHAPHDEIRDAFATAIKTTSDAVQARLALIAWHLSLNEVQPALTAAQQGVEALPDSAEMRAALGKAQIASGDLNQAIASFNKLLPMQPGSVQPLVLLADAYLRAGNRAEAAQQLQRALTIEPGNVVVQRGLAELRLREGRHDDALKLARDIIKQRPRAELGYVVEGAVYAAQKKWDQALASYRAGLAALPESTELAARTHAMLIKAGKPADAQAQATKWQRDHPKDAGFRFYLGDEALARGDNASAEAHYREVMKLQPGNALAFNNVAWLMASDNKPGAVELAQEANRLLPNRPNLLDTLALALARDKQFDKAIEVMRQATSLAPTDAPLRINLARLLAEAGNKDAAKTELHEMIKSGSTFARQDEARALLNSL